MRSGGSRRAALVLAAASLAGCVPAPEAAYVATPAGVVSTGDLARRAEGVERTLRQATLRVRNRTCSGLGYGSGFAIQSHLLVTNRHVVQGADVVQISTWDGQSLDVAVSGYAVTNDVAIVETVDALPGVLEFGSPPAPGAEVTAVGYPLGGAVRFSPGEVVDYVPGVFFGESTPTMRVTNALEPGNSGGPLVDADGHVVGVVFALEVATDLGLAIPVDVLLEIMDRQKLREQRSAC
jgi:S1-C subfamily serine protease